MIRHHIPRTLAQTLVSAAAVLTIVFAGASCSPTSGTTAAAAAAAATATATTTDPPTTVAPTSTSAPTSAPTTAVTAPAPPTTGAPTTTAAVPGQTVVFAMSDGDLAFTLTTDEIDGTARFALEPVDGAPTPRWETVVPWVDEANASGHRPFDGLPAEPVSGGDITEANLALVQDYVTTALVEGRWEDVDRFFADGRYVLHGPLFADGLESVRSFFIGLRDAGVPFLITDTSVWLAAGDFVLAIHRHDAGGVATAYWDLWRVENDTIAEHWDAISTIDASIADAWFAGSGPAM